MEKIFQIPFQMDSNAHERRKTTRGNEKKKKATLCGFKKKKTVYVQFFTFKLLLVLQKMGSSNFEVYAIVYSSN
jgi:hypothetical protein